MSSYRIKNQRPAGPGGPSEESSPPLARQGKDISHRAENGRPAGPGGPSEESSPPLAHQSNDPHGTDNVSASDPEAQEKAPLDIRREVISWVVWVAGMLLAVFLIRTFIFTMAVVDGVSMLPTLRDGDRLVAISKLYKLERGDIIIFEPKGYPGKLYVKRVIALEGQTVNIDTANGVVYVDGEALDEPYISEPSKILGNVSFPAQVPPDHVFVMGDNRNRSQDSRWDSVGMVNKKSIAGEAALRLWPPFDIGLLE